MRILRSTLALTVSLRNRQSRCMHARLQPDDSASRSLWCCDRTAFLLSFTAASSFTLVFLLTALLHLLEKTDYLSLSFSFILYFCRVLAYKGNTITRARWGHTETENVKGHITHALLTKTKVGSTTLACNEYSVIYHDNASSLDTM